MALFRERAQRPGNRQRIETTSILRDSAVSAVLTTALYRKGAEVHQRPAPENEQFSHA
jgi:hypothetical protein